MADLEREFEFSPLGYGRLRVTACAGFPTPDVRIRVLDRYGSVKDLLILSPQDACDLADFLKEGAQFTLTHRGTPQPPKKPKSKKKNISVETL